MVKVELLMTRTAGYVLFMFVYICPCYKLTSVDVAGAVKSDSRTTDFFYRTDESTPPVQMAPETRNWG